MLVAKAQAERIGLISLKDMTDRRAFAAKRTNSRFRPKKPHSDSPNFIEFERPI
jgi:hypothetical protein